MIDANEAIAQSNLFTQMSLLKEMVSKMNLKYYMYMGSGNKTAEDEAKMFELKARVESCHKAMESIEDNKGSMSTYEITNVIIGLVNRVAIRVDQISI